MEASSGIDSVVSVVHCDITTMDTDAIVNAANSSLLGGGGVDGAIHQAAGPGLYEECRHLGGCATSEAKFTAGHNLKARHVIHTVGPIWRHGRRGEEDKLRLCYSNCLKLAEEHQLKSIAFPAISTGAYGFPVERASTIAVSAIREHLRNGSGLKSIVLVCYNPAAFDAYTQAVKEASKDQGAP